MIEKQKPPNSAFAGLTIGPAIIILWEMKVSNAIAHYRVDAELYDYFAKQHPMDADSARRIHEAILSKLDIPDGAMVLDIGSGNGWLHEALSAKNCTVVSAELGIRNLLEMKKRFGDSVTGIIANAERLPFHENSFDCIVASEIMEHMNVPELLVSEAYRVLKPTGQLLISTPYKEKLRTYLCVHCNNPTPANAHIQSFDEQKHGDILKQSGFTRVNFSLLRNKIFVFSRVSYMFRFMPFSIWRLFDSFFMFIVRKANTIVIRAHKE